MDGFYTEKPSIFSVDFAKRQERTIYAHKKIACKWSHH